MKQKIHAQNRAERYIKQIKENTIIYLINLKVILKNSDEEVSFNIFFDDFLISVKSKISN